MVRIIVECKPDEVLVRELCKHVDIIHAPNKPEALKQVTKYNYSIIIVDEDPASLKQFRRL